MNNVLPVENAEVNGELDLGLSPEVTKVQKGFWKHLFEVIDPDCLIDDLGNCRAANDDIELKKVA